MFNCEIQKLNVTQTNRKMTKYILSKEDIIKAEVIVAAQMLFQKYGFSKTTMEDIAKTMGRGKSTLYYYYKSKNEIFEAVIQKEADEVFSTVSEATRKASSAEEKLEAYMKTSFMAVKSRFNLYGIMKEEIFGEGDLLLNRPAMKVPINQYNNRDRQAVKDILLFGIENKEFAPDLKENIDLVAYIAITSLRSISVDMAFNEKDLAPFFEADKINAMITIFLRGLKN
jgi:AcrR family transcriptional regulator